MALTIRSAWRIGTPALLLETAALPARADRRIAKAVVK
jgi:hypothetical protein